MLLCNNVILLQYHLLTGIHEFLVASAPKLQKVFDTSCGFWNVQAVLMQHNEEMVERITNLRSKTQMLCGMGPEEVTESCMILQYVVSECYMDVSLSSLY